MKIRGRNALNANIIRRLVFDFDEIRATSGVKAYPNNGTILNRIKELSDNEQRKEVLEMFLSGDTIHTLIPKIEYNGKWYIRVVMSSDRLLDLRLEDTIENKNLIRMITNKYKQDRYLKLLNEEYDYYLIRDTKSVRRYYVTQEKIKNKIIKTFTVELLKEDECVYDLIKTIIDKELIDKGVDDISNQEVFELCDYNWFVYVDYLIANKNLKISSKYNDIVKEYIGDLVRKNNEAKKLQMKMEGF